MQRIEILSAEVQVKSGTSTGTGKPYTIREQSAVLHDTKMKYPQPCRVQLSKDQPPYAVGLYDIESPFSVGLYESLKQSRDMSLVPVKTAKAA